MGEILELAQGAVAAVLALVALGLMVRGALALPSDLRALARSFRPWDKSERRVGAPLRALEPGPTVIGRIGPGGRR